MGDLAVGLFEYFDERNRGCRHDRAVGGRIDFLDITSVDQFGLNRAAKHLASTRRLSRCGTLDERGAPTFWWRTSG